MGARALHALGCRSGVEKSEGQEGCGRSGRVFWGQGRGWSAWAACIIEVVSERHALPDVRAALPTCASAVQVLCLVRSKGLVQAASLPCLFPCLSLKLTLFTFQPVLPP